MKNLSIVLCLIVLYNLIWNLYSYFKCKSLYKDYKTYIECIASDTPYKGNIIYKKNEIIRLFKEAGISNSHYPITIPTGFNMAANTTMNVFESMFTNNQVVIGYILNNFNTAIGEYLQRVYNSINPLYWIRTMIFLPKTVFEYIGMKSDTLPVRIFQIVYWIISFLYAIYDESINNYIKLFLSSLFR